MARHWLLTSTTYGTWLPGDQRGFVSPVKDELSGGLVLHNIPGTPCDADIPELLLAARQRMKGPAVRFIMAQASVVLDQFRETAGVRDWRLLAVAVMSNHIHIVCRVPGDPDPSTLLRDFKSYASRALNRRWPRPMSGTWWTESGSKRKLADERAVIAAIDYVYHRQPYHLVRWMDPAFVDQLRAIGEREA
jgi:REP element-mobilizing transposase RayT